MFGRHSTSGQVMANFFQLPHIVVDFIRATDSRLTEMASRIEHFFQKRFATMRGSPRHKCV
ncbi:unnamed protein product, partial [Trichogramma brassicae]